MVLTASVCVWLGFSAKRAATAMEKAMSGLVNYWEHQLAGHSLLSLFLGLGCFCREIWAEPWLLSSECWLGLHHRGGILLELFEGRLVARVLLFFFSRCRSTFSPRQKLIGPISTISNATASSILTLAMTPLPFGPMILISSTNVLTTGPSKPCLVTKMPWSALIRLIPSFSRRNDESRSYYSRGDCLGPFADHVLVFIAIAFWKFNKEKLINLPIKESSFDIHLIYI